MYSSDTAAHCSTAEDEVCFSLFLSLVSSLPPPPPLPPPFGLAASVATATESPGGCVAGAGWWRRCVCALSRLPWLFQLSDSVTVTSRMATRVQWFLLPALFKPLHPQPSLKSSSFLHLYRFSFLLLFFFLFTVLSRSRPAGCTDREEAR